MKQVTIWSENFIETAKTEKNILWFYIVLHLIMLNTNKIQLMVFNSYFFLNWNYII